MTDLALGVGSGGCIIRARLLDTIIAAYKANPQLPSLLLDPTVATMLKA
jgi:6-phosphogluconate dehydrogenase